MYFINRFYLTIHSIQCPRQLKRMKSIGCEWMNEWMNVFDSIWFNSIRLDDVYLKDLERENKEKKKQSETNK